MYCPFQKTTTNLNSYGLPIYFGNELIVSVGEKFSECFGYECAAWDEEHQYCLLCHGHAVKGV